MQIDWISLTTQEKTDVEGKLIKTRKLFPGKRYYITYWKLDANNNEYHSTIGMFRYSELFKKWGFETENEMIKIGDVVVYAEYN